MRLELVERLVCPSLHARTPLIFVVWRAVDRDLIEGQLGCPVCRRDGVVANGHVILEQTRDRDVAAQAAPSASGARDGATVGASADALSRLEALLGIADPGARVLLTGRYAALADALARDTDALVVALNQGTTPESGVGSLFVGEPVLPFSDATFTAAAFDADIPPAQLTDALRTLVRGARIVGALPLTLPAGVRELARDAVEWVGERDALPSDVVPLRRA